MYTLFCSTFLGIIVCLHLLTRLAVGVVHSPPCDATVTVFRVMHSPPCDATVTVFRVMHSPPCGSTVLSIRQGFGNECIMCFLHMLWFLFHKPLQIVVPMLALTHRKQIKVLCNCWGSQMNLLQFGPLRSKRLEDKHTIRMLAPQ